LQVRDSRGKGKQGGNPAASGKPVEGEMKGGDLGGRGWEDLWKVQEGEIRNSVSFAEMLSSKAGGEKFRSSEKDRGAGSEKIFVSVSGSSQSGRGRGKPAGGKKVSP